MFFIQPAEGITRMINRFESQIFWEVGNHIDIKIRDAV